MNEIALLCNIYIDIKKAGGQVGGFVIDLVD